ncbi:MAG: DUF6259 domain-containing protein [Promethearchaeota archaeon]
MKNAWFAAYHAYSISKDHSPRAVRAFARDVKFAAEKLDVEYVIVEDYYERFIWGEFSRPWSERTLREMIAAVHDRGLKFLPYTDATELAMQGREWPLHGREWGAKNRWGKVYCGFSSLMYPSVYYFPQHEFYLRVMCPLSGWREHLCREVERLGEMFEIDGIYVDRLDYRVECYDHVAGNPGHFGEGLVPLLRGMKKAATAKSNKNVLVMNDSCMNPDAVMAELYRVADAVLSELLLADMNPWGLENILATNWGDLAWKFRRVVRPALTHLLPRLYQTGVMTNPERMRSIIHRIRRAAGDPDKPVFMFSHRTGRETLEFQREIAKSEGTRMCFYNGVKPLSSIELPEGW